SRAAPDANDAGDPLRTRRTRGKRRTRTKRGPAPARVPAGRHENGAVTEPGHRRRVAIREGVRGLPPLPPPPSPPAPPPHPAGHPPQSSRPPAPLAHNCPVGSPFALLSRARAPTSRTTPRRTATLRPGRRRSRPGGPLGRSRG